MQPEQNGAGDPPSASWAEQLRLARARALARGIRIEWERLAVPEGEREATERLRDQLPPPAVPSD
jgi:hypothetical protein